jgi:ribosomal protein L17
MMSDEELRRAVEFIVTTQAKSEHRLDRLERVVKLAVRAGLRARRDVREQLTALVDAQIKTEAALRDLGTRTDARINALLDAIERHTADGHGAT